MAFIGKTFNYRPVTAGDDGYLYDILSGQQNFMLSVTGGNPFTITNNVLTIKQCYMLISGRVIRVEANTTISLGTIPTSATKGRVILRLDMSKLATETTFRQIETEVETTSSSFRTLVQQNINSIDGQSANIYEVAICEFTCSSGTASAPTRTLAGNPFPIPVANGGTGATALVTAQSNLGISYNTTELTTGSITSYADGLANKQHKVIMGISGQSVTDLPDNATSTLEIYKFDTNSIAVIATKLDGSIYIKTKRNGTWGSWQRVYAPPQITKITFNGNASAGALQNLQIQSAEVLSGASFVDTTTSAWNYYVPVGTYRITLQAQFPTGSATDYFGIMAGSDATPNYSLACQFGCGLPVVQRLNASGIMVNTNSSEAHSLIVRSSKALTDCSGFLTIEKLT